MVKPLLQKMSVMAFSLLSFASVNAQEYCTNDQTNTHAQRYLTSFSLSDGSNSVSVDVGQRRNSPIYFDKKTNTFTTTAGATITPTINWTGEWMHSYVLIDFDKDAAFIHAVDANNVVTDASEVRAYSSYAGGTEVWTNHLGESTQGSTKADLMKPFTIPSHVSPGTYLLRFKVDWNSVDPCGVSDIGKNGGVIVDINLVIESDEVVADRTVTLEVGESGGGTVSGGGSGTGVIECVATPAEGYVFLKWINKLTGDIVSTNSTYRDSNEGDITLVAIFGQMATQPSSEFISFNGSQYARIPNSEDIQRSSTEDYTMSCWVRTSDLAQNSGKRFIGYRADRSYSGFEAYAVSSGYGVTCSTSPSDFLIDDSFTANNAQWVHLAIVFDRSALNNYLYVNGVKAVSSRANNASAVLNLPSDMLLGAGWDGTTVTNFFTGDLADVRIYKKALTVEDILLDAASEYAALSDELKAVCSAAYAFEAQPSTESVVDLSGKNNDAALHGFTITSVGNIKTSDDIYALIHGDEISLVGVEAGVAVDVYSVSGEKISSKIADNTTVKVNVASKGVFIIKAGMSVLKIVK